MPSTTQVRAVESAVKPEVALPMQGLNMEAIQALLSAFQQIQNTGGSIKNKEKPASDQDDEDNSDDSDFEQARLEQEEEQLYQRLHSKRQRMNPKGAGEQSDFGRAFPLVCVESVDDTVQACVAKESKGGCERTITFIPEGVANFVNLVSNDPLGGGKKFPPLHAWRTNDQRDEVQFLDDFEARVEEGVLGTQRCQTFGMYIQCPVRKLRVTEMLQECKRSGKKPRWVNLRKSFLVGSSNIIVHVSTALSRVQTLKQMADENPEEFLSRLRREKSKLEDLAANTHKAHVVATGLNDDAMIRTFYDGLVPRYRDIKNEVMRRAISMNHTVTAPISTVNELSAFLSVEMAIIKDNEVQEQGKQIRKRGQEIVLNKAQVEEVKSDDDCEPAFKSIRPLSSKVADREVFRETHRNTKETVQDHVSFFDDADGDDVEEDEEPLPRRDPPSRNRKRVPFSKTSKVAPPPNEPKQALVNVEEVDDSSSEDEVLPPKIERTKRRKTQSGPDPQTSAIQLATIQLLATLTKAADGMMPSKAKEVPVNAKPDLVGGGIPRAGMNKATCFFCAEGVQDLREHICQQKKDKVLTCPHCKLPVKAKTLPSLFEHMFQCDRRSCGKCKSKTHSFYFCPTYQCFVCKKYGHSRLLHKWGAEGAALIALNSQDDAGN